MNVIVGEWLHVATIILAIFGFSVFYLNQIWKSIHVDASYGEKLLSVKQPKKEMLILAFIVLVGIVVVYRLIIEWKTPNESMPESYYQVLLGAIVLVVGLIVFIIIRTLNPTKIFTNGILVHDFGYVSWEDMKSVDKTPKGQFQVYLVKPRQFKGKMFYISYDPSQEEEMIQLFRKYVY